MKKHFVQEWDLNILKKVILIDVRFRLVMEKCVLKIDMLLKEILEIKKEQKEIIEENENYIFIFINFLICNLFNKN